MTRRFSYRSAAVAALALPLFFAACRDPKITTYSAPKDAPAEVPLAMAPAAPMAADSMAGADASTIPVGSDALTWTAPADWQAKATSAMRKGSYAVPAPGPNATDDDAADLAIFAFPGDTGGLLSNLNRWRGQIGLPPIQENELPQATTQLTQGTLQFTIVDFTATADDMRLIGAVLSGHGETYFFKMTGPRATLAAQKQAFLDMLKTVRLR